MVVVLSIEGMILLIIMILCTGADFLPEIKFANVNAAE